MRTNDHRRLGPDERGGVEARLSLRELLRADRARGSSMPSAQTNDMGGKLARKFGIKNLAYNMRPPRPVAPPEPLPGVTQGLNVRLHRQKGGETPAA